MSEYDTEEMYGYPYYEDCDIEESYALALEAKERELEINKGIEQREDTVIDCTDLVVYRNRKIDGAEMPIYGLIVGDGKVYVPKEGIIDYGEAEPLYKCTMDIYSLLQKLYGLSKKYTDMHEDISDLEHRLNEVQKMQQDVEIEQAKLYKQYKSIMHVTGEKAKLKEMLDMENM